MSGSPPEVAFEISRPASIPIPVETQAETSTSGLELLDSSTAVIENSGSPLSTPLDYSTIPKALQGAGVHAEAPPAIDSEAAELLGRYQTGVAVWMDLFDHRMFYQRDVVRRAFTSRLLLYAVCAFAAKQLSTVRSSEVWGPVAARYYGEALPLLMRVLTDPAAHKEDALTAIIILSSYEILAAPGVEHKRHLYGAFTLIKTYSINAGSKALERASFWIYVRQDVVMALINECPLLLSPMNWNVSFSEHEVEEDALGNQILWLLGQTINLVFHKPGANAKRSNREIHIRISEQLNAWFEGLSLSFTGARCGMMLPQGFVRVCFSGAAAAAAMLMYHLTKLLLLAKSHGQISDNDRTQIQYHAEQIASIGFSDIPSAAFVQATQPIYYAAKHINPLAKKVRLWALLEKIETELGFHTSSRVEKLQRADGALE